MIFENVTFTFDQAFVLDLISSLTKFEFPRIAFFGVLSILEDLQLVNRTTLFAVLTLYKRFYDGVNILIENTSTLKKTNGKISRLLPT